MELTISQIIRTINPFTRLLLFTHNLLTTTLSTHSIIPSSPMFTTNNKHCILQHNKHRLQRINFSPQLSHKHLHSSSNNSNNHNLRIKNQPLNRLRQYQVPQHLSFNLLPKLPHRRNPFNDHVSFIGQRNFSHLRNPNNLLCVRLHHLLLQ